MQWTTVTDRQPERHAVEEALLLTLPQAALLKPPAASRIPVTLTQQPQLCRVVAEPCRHQNAAWAALSLFPCCLLASSPVVRPRSVRDIQELHIEHPPLPAPREP